MMWCQFDSLVSHAGRFRRAQTIVSGSVPFDPPDLGNDTPNYVEREFDRQLNAQARRGEAEKMTLMGTAKEPNSLNTAADNLAEKIVEEAFSSFEGKLK